MDMKQRIKDLCKKNEISMNALEKKLGLGIGYISKLGKTVPSTKKIQLIADYFNVSIDYIMTGEEYKSEFTPEQATLDLLLSQDMELKEALKLYATLSDEKKKHIIETIKMMSEGK